MIVKVIKSGRGTTLIEWIDKGRLKRAWIPEHLLNEDHEVSERTLRECVPYGLPFEKIFKSVTISALDLADAMRRRGIWTEFDLMKNPGDVQKAIVSAAELSVSRLQTAVRELEVE